MSNPFPDEDPAWTAAYLAALPGMAVKWTSSSDVVVGAALVADATIVRLARRKMEREKAHAERVAEARGRVLAQRTYTHGSDPMVWTVEAIDGEDVRLTAPSKGWPPGEMNSHIDILLLAYGPSNFKPTP